MPGGFDPDAYVVRRLHATASDGAQVPITLTSRADAPRARIASCAVAVLLAQATRNSVVTAVDG